MSEPSSGSMQTTIIRHIDREVVEGRFYGKDHFRACWDRLCFPFPCLPFSPLFFHQPFSLSSTTPFPPLLLYLLCPLSLPGTSTGADDVISSVQFDRQQLTTTWRKAVVFAVHTSPIKQFGIGFGIGWWVCSLALLFLSVCLSLMVKQCQSELMASYFFLFLIGFQGTCSKESAELQHSWLDALL